MSTVKYPAPFRFLRQLQEMRLVEEEQSRSNQFLAEALETEKREGHKLAVIARTIALGLVMVLLPVLNSNLNVLYYEFAVLIFIGLGWLQLKVSSVGQSKTELALIFVDLGLLYSESLKI